MNLFKIIFLFCVSLSFADAKNNINSLFMLVQNNDEICQEIFQEDDDNFDLKLEWDLMTNSYYLHCQTGNTMEDNVIFLIHINEGSATIYQKEDVTTIVRGVDSLEPSYRSDNSWIDSLFCEKKNFDNSKLVFITKVPSEDSTSPYCYDVEEVSLSPEDKVASDSNKYKIIYNFIVSIEKETYMKQLNYYLSYIDLKDNNLPLETKKLISYYIENYSVNSEQKNLYLKIAKKWLEKGYVDDAHWLTHTIK